MKKSGVNTGVFKKKTGFSPGVLLPAMAVAVVFVSFILWIFSAAPVFIAFASSVIELCHGLFNRCLGYVAFARMAFFWAGGLILLSGLVFAACRAAATLFRSYRAIRRLPLKNKGANVVLIEDRTISAAFTHGIIRPRIYISRGLMESLDCRELRAVLHHELCHKKNCDPLRFFLLSILKDIFFFIPLASYLYGLIGDRQEKKADDRAVSSMCEPLSIAGALVKLAREGAPRPVETASILGRKGHMEGRIKRLIGEESAARSALRPRGSAILVSFILPVFMLISLAMPLKDSMPPRISTCTTSHCSKHKAKPDKHCHTHCEKTAPMGKTTPLKTLPQAR